MPKGLSKRKVFQASEEDVRILQALQDALDTPSTKAPFGTGISQGEVIRASLQVLHGLLEGTLPPERAAVMEYVTRSWQTQREASHALLLERQQQARNQRPEPGSGS